MALWQWSTTAANNATADPSINWQEGQAPSTVNDSARAMMAVLASALMANREWINFGDTPTYVNATQFTVPGNQTANYTVGRRVRATVTAGTVYGTISTSVYTSLTTVTISLDSGALDSGVSEVDVGIQNSSNPSVPVIPNYSDAGGGGGQTRWVFGNYGVMARNDGSSFYLLQTASGSPYGGFSSLRPFYWNLASGAVTLDATGAGVTCGGNLTANSDERLKEDWEYYGPDFVDRLSKVKGGTYKRVDIGKRHVGVGAQSLQALMPEAVVESEKGILSVAYGQAALAACVELAKEVVRLRALVEPK